MTKQELLDRGVELMGRFCELNNLQTPKVITYDSHSWPFPKKACAYYRRGEIHISVRHCAAIGRGGPSWSYPGYVIDRTPYGVIQHELGHHVDYVRSLLLGAAGAYGGEFSERMRADVGEEKLTNYCPNDWEWFAEMFRLFVTNPDLLRHVRPETHLALLEAGFKPVEQRFWWKVLEDAPQRTLDRAMRKGHFKP